MNSFNTVKSSHFVTGSKFRHPRSEFLGPSAMFVLKDIKNFQKHTLLEIFFSFDLALCKKMNYMVFFKICTLSLFVTKLILKTSKNLLKNKHKEAKYKTAIPMKFSSKFSLSTNVKKNINFSFCFKLFWGGDEI